MIECTDSNIWYKKRPKHRRKKLKRCFIFILILFILFVNIKYYKNTVCTRIFEICNDYAYSYSCQAVNNAVLLKVSQNTEYSNLIFVEKNTDGNITLISTNSQKINDISRNIAKVTQQLLSSHMENGIPIPLLAFSGIDLLSGYGDIVMLKTANVVSVTCDFSSKFESVGINQTRHSIYIDVLCDISIKIPLSLNKTQHKTSVLISEAILVGKVPETYLNGKLFG